jgi:hypothetical protein
MSAVQPFRIAIPDADLTDLRERLHRTRWPERECVDDWSQGIPLDYTRELATYWADVYDWRQRERALNRFDQFTTEIDGLPIISSTNARRTTMPSRWSSPTAGPGRSSSSTRSSSR